MSVSTTIKAIQDIMRKDAGVDGDAQRISQLGWMLFLKIFDDREQEYELLDDAYLSPILERLRWRNWAANDEGITGDALLDFVNNDLFPSLKELQLPSGGTGVEIVIRSIFNDSYNYMKNGTLIRQIVNKINAIDFNSSQDRHIFGDIYEKILKDLQSAGNAGEFYTPRAVTQFMVDMVNPQLGEIVLDPACGTGGFLACTIDNIRSSQVRTVEDETLLQRSIHGIEKKQLPHLLCTTNMMLHGIDVPVQIRHDNTLARPLKDYGPRDHVDVVVTNPPFGGMEEDGIETNFPSTFQTRETADLFLVLIIHLLKDGGRAAIVLPDGGTLSGDGVKARIKEKLLSECNLHTIVRLPNGVFNPYTGIRTNLLIFTKGEPTKEIWYYEHPYPEGYKSYSKTKPIRIEEFEQEKAWWNNRKENEHAWRVPIEEVVRSNYNLDIKNPNTPVEENGDPVKLLARYRAVSAAVEETRDALKAELMAALGEPKQNGGVKMNIEGATIEDLFFSEFATLAAAPSGVQKLRELSLQLAVQGKLVPQDPADEPASVLIEQIKAEKARLVKAGEIKKAKPLPPVTDDEVPYAVPKSWMWTRYDEIATIMSNLVDPKRYPDLPHIAPNNIEKGTARLLDYCSVREDGVESPNHHFYQNHLIYSKIRPNLSKLMVADFEGLCSADMYPIKSHIDLQYLKYYMLSIFFYNQAVSDENRLAMPKINQEQLRNVIICIPPLAEQHRIVTKVDALMKLCDTLEAQIRKRQEVQAKLLEVIVAEVAVQG